MSATIAILDDEAERVDAMLAALSRSLPAYDVVTFRTAQETIEWLDTSVNTAALISLDHDLIRLSPDEPEMGDGREVADFLATRSPVCHVIVHSTNFNAAVGMEMALNESGWQTTRVNPYDDLAWVSERWIHEVKNHVLPADRT